MAIVDELVSILGLDIDPKAEGTAYKFGFLLGQVGKASVQLGAALATAAGAVAAYVGVQAAAIDREAELAATLGVSYDAYQRLAYAAKLSGGDTQTLNADLERLQETMLNPATGKQHAALTALGISARTAAGELKTADQIVFELAGKFENLTKAEQNQYARLLRISPATVRLLQNGQKGLADMGAEAESLGIILDEKAAAAAAEFGDSLDRVKATSEGLGRAVAVGLLPGLTRVIGGFTDWLKANRQFIAMGITQVVEGVGLGFQMVGSAVSAVWDVVRGFLPALDDLTENLDLTRAIAIAVALAIGAAGIAAAISAAPFIAMAAVIAAVVLVVEDLYALFTGGESVIGDWIDTFKSAYPQIAAVIGAIIDVVGMLASAVGEGLVQNFLFLKDTISGVFSALINDVQVVLGWVDKLVSGVKSIAGTVNLNSIADAVAAEAPVPAGVVAAANSSTSQTIAPVITINGAGDPAAVGREVVTRSGLGATLQQSRPGARGPAMG